MFSTSDNQFGFKNKLSNELCIYILTRQSMSITDSDQTVDTNLRVHLRSKPVKPQISNHIYRLLLKI